MLWCFESFSYCVSLFSHSATLVDLFSRILLGLVVHRFWTSRQSSMLFFIAFVSIRFSFVILNCLLWHRFFWSIWGSTVWSVMVSLSADRVVRPSIAVFEQPLLFFFAAESLIYIFLCDVSLFTRLGQKYIVWSPFIWLWILCELVHIRWYMLKKLV